MKPDYTQGYSRPSEEKKIGTLYETLNKRRKDGELLSFDELKNRDLYRLLILEEKSSEEIARLFRCGVTAVNSRRTKLGYTKKGISERGILSEIESIILNYLEQSDLYKATCLKILADIHPEFDDCGYRKVHDLRYIEEQ